MTRLWRGWVRFHSPALHWMHVNNRVSVVVRVQWLFIECCNAEALCCSKLFRHYHRQCKFVSVSEICCYTPSVGFASEADSRSLGFSRCLQRQLCFVFWLFRGRLIRFIFVGDTFGRIWITAQARFVGYGSFKNIRTFPYFERSTSQVTSRPPSPPPHSTAVRLLLSVDSVTDIDGSTYASGADRNHQSCCYY